MLINLLELKGLGTLLLCTCILKIIKNFEAQQNLWYFLQKLFLPS